MGKNSCQLQIRCEDGELVARLCGELDHHGAVAVRTLIDAQIRECQPHRTVIELSGLDFMDSSGLGLIMGRLALMQSIGGELCVREPNERVRKIFCLAGLERMVRIECEDGGKERLK